MIISIGSTRSSFLGGYKMKKPSASKLIQRTDTPCYHLNSPHSHGCGLKGYKKYPTALTGVPVAAYSDLSFRGTAHEMYSATVHLRSFTDRSLSARLSDTYFFPVTAFNGTILAPFFSFVNSFNKKRRPAGLLFLSYISLNFSS